MSRTLNGAMATRVASRYTDPGFLISITVATGVVLRYSTRGTVDWNGSVWTPIGAQPPQYQTSATGVQTGTLTFQSVNQALLTAVLLYGIADKPIDIYVFDAGALASNEPVLDFSGVGDAMTWNERTMTIRVASQSSRVQFSPRLIISKENGFSHLPSPGMTFVWNNEVYELTS